MSLRSSLKSKTVPSLYYRASGGSASHAGALGLLCCVRFRASAVVRVLEPTERLSWKPRESRMSSMVGEEDPLLIARRACPVSMVHRLRVAPRICRTGSRLDGCVDLPFNDGCDEFCVFPQGRLLDKPVLLRVAQGGVVRMHYPLYHKLRSRKRQITRCLSLGACRFVLNLMGCAEFGADSSEQRHHLRRFGQGAQQARWVRRKK